MTKLRSEMMLNGKHIKLHGVIQTNEVNFFRPIMGSDFCAEGLASCGAPFETRNSCRHAWPIESVHIDFKRVTLIFHIKVVGD